MPAPEAKRSRIGFSGYCAIAVAGIALLVLAGWELDIRILKAILPSYITMKVNTAVCFLLLSVALWTLRKKTGRFRFRFSLLLTLTVLAISFLTLAQYLFGLNLGIDEFFFTDPEGIGLHFPPGRLAPITAVDFILLSFGFILGNIPSKPFFRTAQFLTALAFITALQALVGYLLGITYLFGTAFYTQMAAHTTVAFIILCAGVLASRPDQGYVKFFSSQLQSAPMMRKLLAFIIVTPIVVHVLVDFGFRRGYYDDDFAILIQVMGNIVLMGALLISSAQALYYGDIAREEARLRAESANRAKTNFLANISHEIRTPLGAVLGFSDLLLTDRSDAERNDHSEAIRRNGAQLLRLIDDLLDISKVESGHLGIVKERFNLNDFVSDVVSFVKLKAEEAGLSFELKTHPPLPETIESDAARIRQVLLNLTGNAIKFNEAGGTVAVTMELLDSLRQLLRFSVRDTGGGVPEEFKLKLFQPFSQADSSTTRRHGGSGLGLALSKQIAHALGGDVHLVRPRDGKGAVFCFDIDPGPLDGVRMTDLDLRADRDASHKAAAGPEPESVLSGVSVLLVEDAPDNQRLISRYLESAGAKVDVAADGVEGIDKALHNRFDIVLMDLQMPNLDGYGAIQKLRGIGYKIPIVALTAHAMKEDRDQCLKIGFNEHLTKPVNKSTLIHTVDSFAHLGST